MIFSEKNKSSINLRIRRLLHRIVDAKSAPKFFVSKDAKPHNRWILFFCYFPNDIITNDHYLTIKNLLSTNYNLMIVAAANNRLYIEESLLGLCDSLIIKELPGYDFSGYSIGLRHILSKITNINVIVVNDSVIGPITDLVDLLESRSWGLTGLTSCEVRENHIQSYAFMLKNLTIKKLNKLKSIFPENIAYSDYMAVVRMQESRFARVASKHMTVGSIWHGKNDMTIFEPLHLITSGFPFIKKSLFSKFECMLSNDSRVKLNDIYNKYHNVSAD